MDGHSQTETLSGASGGTTQIVKIEGLDFKPLSQIILVLVIALFVTLPPSLYAIILVSEYTATQEAKLDDLNWRYRQLAYWAQTLDAQVEAHGLNVQSPPILNRDFEKKGKHP